MQIDTWLAITYTTKMNKLKVPLKLVSGKIKCERVKKNAMRLIDVEVNEWFFFFKSTV